MTRPRRLLCVLGTHTEVGKTWVGAQLAALARARGLRVGARKPVQSFDASSAADTDALVLSRATGEPVNEVCRMDRNYPLALAPPMAADLLGRSRIALEDLLREIHWPAGLDLGLVETAGGLRSPLAHDGDSVDLTRRLEPDRIVLVADAGLGTLNSVRLSLAELDPLDANVFINRFDADNELHRLNQQWLETKYGVRTVTSIETLLTEVIRSD